ncbi:MAG: hypothetical protein WD046_03235 [Paracoccaceae bacterium]
MDRNALNAELIRLHGSENAARLNALHLKAATLSDDAGWQRFHLTHAWVYALVAGLDETPQADALRKLGGL